MSSAEKDQMKGQYSTSYSYSSFSQINDEEPVIDGERHAEEGSIDEVHVFLLVMNMNKAHWLQQHGNLRASKTLHEKYNPASHRLEPSAKEQKALEEKQMENK